MWPERYTGFSTQDSALVSHHMSDIPNDGEITTVEEFDTAFGNLLSEAMRNGIDPRGSWVYRNSGEEVLDLEAEIVELAPDESAIDFYPHTEP